MQKYDFGIVTVVRMYCSVIFANRASRDKHIGTIFDKSCSHSCKIIWKLTCALHMQMKKNKFF